MKINRRTFLKTSGCMLASILSGGKAFPLGAAPAARVLFGREVASRCPLCSLGCGLIYRSRGQGRWHVEGDPDCPIAEGSLCARGSVLTTSINDSPAGVTPLYRPPGSNRWKEIGWEEAVKLTARRIKDLRDRELGYVNGDGGKPVNRFDGLGVLAGGSLTNEEAYTVSKLFRALGVTNMDTTVRSSHAMALLGLMDSLGFPGATHPAPQVVHSDVVVLVGCNPGLTAPPLARALNRVRQRRGTVIVIDPRRSETVKGEDLWLQLRPGTDNAVLGAMLSWILTNADISKGDLIEYTDASYISLSEVMGRYERYTTGKYQNWNIVDESLQEPYSIFQRMKENFERYDIRKVSNIAGVDVGLLRRACSLLARTTSADFSATFVFGSGALSSPSGPGKVRMALAIQALLGNLDKKGGGIVLPVGAGNAQGVCDMGLLAPYLPGYLPLPRQGDNPDGEGSGEALEALLRSWYPGQTSQRAKSYLPVLEPDEHPTISTILEGMEDERVRALITIGADPAGSVTDSSSILPALDNLDLLVVMDSTLNRTSLFWSLEPGRETSIKTEVLFIPIQAPVQKNGSMTDGGRRVRRVTPPEGSEDTSPGLLRFVVQLGNSIQTNYSHEGGVLPGPVKDLDWPLERLPEEVAAEINGSRSALSGDILLPPGKDWQSSDRCPNHLYRGWVEAGRWKASDRDRSDPYALGLYERWGWFWPWGIADPFSWIIRRKSARGVYLRWHGQETRPFASIDVLPIRPHLPVKFWKQVQQGSPFPEHYEPFHSPLSDFLTGGRSNPNMVPRHEGKDQWGYLSRRPGDILTTYPVIITLHRTANIMGTGGVTAGWDALRELGTGRIVEIGVELADGMELITGDLVRIISPHNEKGVEARVHVTRRVGVFTDNGKQYHVASVTLFGENGPGINTLTPPAFDRISGGMEMKVFMGRIEKDDG
ncbi:MAG: molybdopterin-dependent oxidoreductase [bacterium]|nr:molybdopterin-dependent oxidoreductase [bacterium]MDT8395184.1 molybdopterin-dependent oxidoreductase [bacterium]